jgi:hypothetical protein
MFTPRNPPVIYALDPGQVKVNDVVLTSQHGFASASIRAFTQSNFSHAAVVTRPGSLIEAVMRGVVRRSLLGVWAARPQWICVLRPPVGAALLSATGQTVAQVAEDGFANPYSLVGAAGTKLTALKALRGQGLFCSELVAAAFSKCGHAVATGAPHTVTPELLRTGGGFRDVTASCVRMLKGPQDDWRLALDVSQAEHPAEEARVLRRTFRALKAGLNSRLLPGELQSTPAIIGWLMSLDRRQPGVAAADDTVSRVLEYGGYVSWYTKVSERDNLGAAATMGALLGVPTMLQGSKQIWIQQLQPAIATLNDRASHALAFDKLFAQKSMRTAHVLREMYRSIEQDVLKRVQVLQLLIAAST